MNIRQYLLALTYMVGFLLLAGCSHSTGNQSLQNQNPTQKHSAPSNESSHGDGTVVSLTPIQVPHTNYLDTYKMIYWSDGVRAEAFLAVPRGNATCPLLVSCHGGYPVANDLTHQPSPEDQSALEYAGPNYITLVPEYRGYDDSEGTVQGLYGDTVDTNNAIKAVMNKFSVAANHIYLDGTSMGGGVVLKLASERNDIRSVIAISPFVGWDIVGEWAEQNQDTSQLARNFNVTMMKSYHTHNPTDSSVKKDSIDLKKIKVPVLLLQGTEDQNVSWTTVEIFYNDLKPYDKQTKLVLYPGGQHGLHDKYQSQVNQEIRSWYKVYGESGSVVG